MLSIDFDTLDVPPGQIRCRRQSPGSCAGKVGPTREYFGIFDMQGLWFVRGNLVRVIAALNKMELLPWDSWGLADCRDEDLTPDDCQLLDKLAQATMADPTDDELIRKLYEDDRIRVPAVIKLYRGRTGGRCPLAGGDQSIISSLFVRAGCITITFWEGGSCDPGYALTSPPG